MCLALFDATFTCSWGPDYEVGDLIVHDTCYQKYFNIYILLSDSQPVHMRSHLIMHCKFAIIPNVRRRKGGKVTHSLSEDTIATIQAGLARLGD